VKISAVNLILLMCVCVCVCVWGYEQARQPGHPMLELGKYATRIVL
jgi:hypothetical protein